MITFELNRLMEQDLNHLFQVNGTCNRKCLCHFIDQYQLYLWQVKQLTHWEWVVHISICKITIIGSDNGFLAGQHRAIIWTDAGIFLTGPLGTNFSDLYISLNKSFWILKQWNFNLNGNIFIHENASENIACKIGPFYPGGDELNECWFIIYREIHHQVQEKNVFTISLNVSSDITMANHHGNIILEGNNYVQGSADTENMNPCKGSLDVSQMIWWFWCNNEAQAHTEQEQSETATYNWGFSIKACLGLMNASNEKCIDAISVVISQKH